MPAKFTVFGQLAEENKGVNVYFDKDGRAALSPSEDAVAIVLFKIDEDGDPVGCVQYAENGCECFDSELLYFGSFEGTETNRSSIACFKGRLVLCLRRERENGRDHFFVDRAEMKLWLLTATGLIGSGALSSLLVRAADEQAARLLAHDKSGEDRGHDYEDDPTTESYLGKDCWLDPERTSLVEIPLGAEAVLHVARV